MQFKCEEDGVVPEEFLAIVEAGGTVQVKTCVGWITVTKEDGLEYRNNMTYQVLENQNV